MILPVVETGLVPSAAKLATTLALPYGVRLPAPVITTACPDSFTRVMLVLLALMLALPRKRELFERYKSLNAAVGLPRLYVILAAGSMLAATMTFEGVKIATLALPPTPTDTLLLADTVTLLLPLIIAVPPLVTKPVSKAPLPTKYVE